MMVLNNSHDTLRRQQKHLGETTITALSTPKQFTMS
jgi:hypothetical protein